MAALPVVFTYCVLQVLFVGSARTQYINHTPSGCADIAVPVPNMYTEIRIDDTNYIFNGDGTCSANPGSAKIECGFKREPDGRFVATAKVCNVQSRRWLGFKINIGAIGKVYTTVYFSQGGQWTHIGSNCLQPQLSTPGVIWAKGLSEFKIQCVRDTRICPVGTQSYIFKNEGIVCGNTNPCATQISGIYTTFSATIQYPIGEKEKISYVYCTTDNSFLGFVIDWAGTTTSTSTTTTTTTTPTTTTTTLKPVISPTKPVGISNEHMKKILICLSVLVGAAGLTVLILLAALLCEGRGYRGGWFYF